MRISDWSSDVCSSDLLDRLGGFPTYYSPNGQAATEALSRAFFRLTDYPPEDRAHVPTETIAVHGGRELFVPKSLKGVAVFSFKRLCAQPLGSADYLAIARRYHTVVIVGVPMLGSENRNEAARFKTLIDALYAYKVKLLIRSAEHTSELQSLMPTSSAVFCLKKYNHSNLSLSISPLVLPSLSQ